MANLVLSNSKFKTRNHKEALDFYHVVMLQIENVISPLPQEFLSRGFHWQRLRMGVSTHCVICRLLGYIITQ